MKRAIIYLRVSTAKQVNKDVDPEGYSLPAQREACHRKAKELGAEVIAEYIDRAETAKTADRPDFQRMLERVKAQRDADYVIVDKVDRFARDSRDAANVAFELRLSAAELVSVKENIDNTPAGRLVFSIMAGIAEFYSRNLATEALKGMTQKAKVGGTPGRAPIGYLNVREVVDGREIRTIAVDKERAPHVQWAFEAYATGDWTVKELTAELDRRGLRSLPIGKKPSLPLHWSRVAHTLNNLYYTGVVRFRGHHYPGRHEPIITPELFLQVAGVLSGRRHAGDKHQRHFSYLKGTVYCGRCDSRLCMTLANGHGGAYLYFFCSGRQRGNGCQQRYVPVDDVEDEIISFYGTVQLDRAEIEERRKKIKAQLAARRVARQREARRQRARLDRLVAKQDRLMQAYYADALPLDLFKREQEKVTQERIEAAAVLAGVEDEADGMELAIDRALDLAENLDYAYAKATDEERRLLNQAVFERLWVHDRRVARAQMTAPASTLWGAEVVEHRRNEASEPEVVLSGVGSNMNDLVPPAGIEPATHGLGNRC
jgi:site-specific DNA recombinase